MLDSLLSFLVFSFISFFLSFRSPLFTSASRLFWRSSSCPLARAQLSPVYPRIRTRPFPTAHSFGACCYRNGQVSHCSRQLISSWFCQCDIVFILESAYHPARASVS